MNATQKEIKDETNALQLKIYPDRQVLIKQLLEYKTRTKRVSLFFYFFQLHIQFFILIKLNGLF